MGFRGGGGNGIELIPPEGDADQGGFGRTDRRCIVRARNTESIEEGIGASLVGMTGNFHRESPSRAVDGEFEGWEAAAGAIVIDRKSTRLNSSHRCISY